MLTGDYASLGLDIKNGAEMAVREKGTLLGHPIELQAEDDGTYAKEPDPAWVKQFETKYGPRQTFSPQAYDAARILMAAVEKTAQKQPDGSLLIGRKALRDAVAETRMDGITGRIEFDPHGDRTGSVVVVYRVAEEGGKRFFKPEDF